MRRGRLGDRSWRFKCIEIFLNVNNGIGDEVVDVWEERGFIVISVVGFCGWVFVRFVLLVDVMGSF